MKNLKKSKFSYPVENPKITSGYGLRVLNFKTQFHNGIDYISKTGKNDVYSILDGKVIYDFDKYEHKKRFSDLKHSGGNYVIIESILDNEIFFIKYLHLLENYVNVNERVNAGDVIGKYADVGYSFGAHLHISVYNSKWEVINPKILFDKFDKPLS